MHLHAWYYQMRSLCCRWRQGNIYLSPSPISNCTATPSRPGSMPRIRTITSCREPVHSSTSQPRNQPGMYALRRVSGRVSVRVSEHSVLQVAEKHEFSPGCKEMGNKSGKTPWYFESVHNATVDQIKPSNNKNDTIDATAFCHVMTSLTILIQVCQVSVPIFSQTAVRSLWQQRDVKLCL